MDKAYMEDIFKNIMKDFKVTGYEKVQHIEQVQVLW
jgi:hypothetical protein